MPSPMCLKSNANPGKTEPRQPWKWLRETNLDQFLADIKSEIEAISDFPENTEKAVIKKLGETDLVAFMAVTGPNDPVQLKALAEQIKRRMLQTGEVPQIKILGFSDHQIRIELKRQTLESLGLSISDIAKAISSQSIDLPAGSIKARDKEVLIRFADERKRVQEFLDLIVVTGKEGGQVELGDIATITDQFETDEDKMFFNGKRAAILEITKTPNEDTLTIIDAIKVFVKKEMARAPPGVNLVITQDISSIVRDRLNLLAKNGLQGLFLVFLSIWFFFGLRYSFWVAMGLPVSFMGAFALMSMIGMSINMMTMIGLLIVIGILMDDAIVIAENIAKNRENGLPPMHAAIEGASDVMPGVMASFATTSLMFGSLIFLKGDLGQIIKVVPIVMLSVLIISIIEAFLVLPSHLGHSLSHASTEKSRMQKISDGLIDFLRLRIFGPISDICVQWRYVTAGATIMLLLLSISLIAGGFVKFSAFPNLDGNTIQAKILLPQGTPLNRTEAVVAKVMQGLTQVSKEMDALQPGSNTLVKHTSIFYNRNKGAAENGPHIATISVDLLNAEIRVGSSDEILNKWRAIVGEIPDVISLKYAQLVQGPAGLAFDLRLVGDDLKELKTVSVEIQNWLKRYKGVLNVGDDLRPGKEEFRVSMKEGSKDLGITAQMVADQLRKSFLGTIVGEIQVQRESYEVDVRLARSDRDSQDDLDQFRIATPNGDLVPLTAVARVKVGQGYSRINRVNGNRAVTVQGDVNKAIANANEILADMRAKLFPDLFSPPSRCAS